MPDNGASEKVNAFFKQHKVAGWGIIIVVGAGAVILYRRKVAQQAASTPTADSSGGASQAAIDPQTGFPVGSPEDQQALQQSGFYGSGYDPYASGYNPFPVATGTGSGGSPGGATGTTISSNDQWLAEAERVLPNGHSSSVETALSRVLGGLTVSWTQRAIFLEAKGIVGEPPNGYPTPIKVWHSGGDNDGNRSHTTVTVPHVVGEQYGAAADKIRDAGLKVTAHPEPGGKVVNQHPAGGTRVRKGSTVSLGTAILSPGG